MDYASVEDLRALKDTAVVIDVRAPDEVHASGVKVEGYIPLIFPCLFVLCSLAPLTCCLSPLRFIKH